MKALQKSLAAAARQWSKVDKSTIRFVAPYAKAHRDVEPVIEANIATDLGPRLDKALTKNSRLCVVGYDGATLARKGYPWRKKITGWLQIGCSIDYFLFDPAPGVIEAVSKISRKIARGSGQIRVFKPKKAQQLSPKNKSEIARLKTFHFAVSENPPTLWIETNHLTSEPKAFDCFFFPERAAVETGLGKTYLKRFQDVVTQACDEVLLDSKKMELNKQKRRSLASGRRVISRKRLTSRIGGRRLRRSASLVV